jgi:hypothetical protein
LHVLQLIPIADECSYGGDILLVCGNEQVSEARADDLCGHGKAVHPRHRVVAFGQIPVLVEELDLLVDRQTCINGLVCLKPPDSF